MSFRSSCFNLVRAILIIVNLIVASLAALFIYISFNAFSQEYEIESGFSDSQHPHQIHLYVTVICAGIGLITVILSLLGMAGAIKRSKSFLITYIAIITLLVSSLIVIILLTYNLASPDAFGNRELDKSIVNSTVVLYNYVEPNDRRTQLIDRVQKSFSCCGINSPNDWSDFNQHKIPKSCCSQPIESSLPKYKYCAESDFRQGCWKALTDHIQENLGSIRCVLYILMGFAGLCACAAIYIIYTIRKTLDVV